MADEVCRSLFGARDGSWVLLESPRGTIPPPTLMVSRDVPSVLVELRYLGDPTDVVRRVHAQLKTHPRADAQGALARLLGVTQQQVSRYMAGLSAPPRVRWPVLIRADLLGVSGG